jgi:hypothetical protein
VTRKQCREARLLLGWSSDRLGAISGTNAPVVRVFEKSGRARPARDGGSSFGRIASVWAALEAAGVVFVDENGGVPGVRLRSASV